ncbi:hypothetical protein [Shewanella surugensis]|uniref:Bacteriocin n=1 Tax=Shewanella surugensis TaxID=212020 RepID=A0ABT0LD95_9GAMM|nr:hypothetical protein [Shewanella surugensis]MCL1125654.1 hypothetical protein [Shewanella surugensis]
MSVILEDELEETFVDVERELSMDVADIVECEGIGGGEYGGGVRKGIIKCLSLLMVN